MRTLPIIVLALPLLCLAGCGPAESDAADVAAVPTGRAADVAAASTDRSGTNADRGAATPEAALAAFVASLKAGNIDAATELIVTPREARRAAAVARSLEQMVTQMKTGTLTWHELRSQGGWCVVVMRLESTQEATTKVRVRDEYLLETHAGWRLAPEAVRGDPVVRERIDADFHALFGWYRANQDAFETTYGEQTAP
ncbi:MAG: hypothetical protein ACYTGR_09555 [Planctomycetota bacterium]|jgi:hypothetical protein